jgi:hypothetical protein
MAAKKKNKKPRVDGAKPSSEKAPSEGLSSDETSSAKPSARESTPSKDSEKIEKKGFPPLRPLPLPDVLPEKELSPIDNPIAIALVMAIALAVLVGLTWNRVPTRATASSGPLDAVPRESFLVGHVDVPALRASPVYKAVLGEADGSAGKALGLDELAKGCGFDPLGRVTELAVAIPEGESRGTFGLAALVGISESELATCAERIGEARGERTTPKTVGSFHVMEEQKGAHPGLAFRQNPQGPHLLLVAEGAWLSSMIATAEGERPSASSEAAHVALATAVTSQPGLEKPTVLATALLPKGLRERLRGELSAEISGASQGAADSPQDVMSAVLSVGGVGLAIRAGGPGEDFDVRAELACEADKHASVLARLVERKRFAWSKDIGLRIVGFGGVIDSIVAEPHGSGLTVRLHAPADDLGRAITRGLELGKPRPSARPEPLPPSARRPPDEVLGARQDAGK